MKKLTFLFSLTLIFLSCQKEKELYYERPDWLQGPLYDQIKSTGEYDEYIKIADLTEYDKVLNSRLSFTVFVPTNEAFQELYQELGLSSADQIDKDYLLEIMQYHTMLNSWDSVKLEGKADFFYNSNDPDNFRTASYYIPPIQEIDGKNVFYGNTFMLLFSTALFQKNGLQAVDYETFYPGSNWTGYNIDRGAIIKNQQGSENGFYNVTDRVLIPRTTADIKIGENEDFSVFKSLIDIFAKYDYSASKSEANFEYDSLFSKSYSLNFNLSNERIMDNNTSDGFYNVFNTVFVPENQIVLDYFSTTFPAYSSIDDVPNIIKKYFVEAHMITNKKLFPTILAKAEDVSNDFSDLVDYDLNNGIISHDICSNALIYGVDRAINSNAFNTVSGPVIKSPDYRIFTMLLELSGEIKSFFKREIGHVIIVLSDDVMTDLGFKYEVFNETDFTDDKITLNDNELDADDMKEFLERYISITSKDVNGIDEAFIKTKDNNFIRLASGQVEGLFGTANILNSYSAINGTVFEIDSLIADPADYTIEDFLNENKDTYSEFFALCDSAGYVNADGEITKMSIFSGITVLVPDNDAVNAIKGTYIPANASTETFNYRQLIQYHTISERVIFTDDVFSMGQYGTDLYAGADRVKISVEGLGNEIRILDNQNPANTITILPGPTSNIIGSNGVVHVIDKVALY